MFSIFVTVLYIFFPTSLLIQNDPELKYMLISKFAHEGLCKGDLQNLIVFKLYVVFSFSFHALLVIMKSQMRKQIAFWCKPFHSMVKVT